MATLMGRYLGNVELTEGERHKVEEATTQSCPGLAVSEAGATVILEHEDRVEVVATPECYMLFEPLPAQEVCVLPGNHVRVLTNGSWFLDH